MDILLGALWVGKGILGETILEERERTSILPGCAVNAGTVICPAGEGPRLI